MPPKTRAKAVKVDETPLASGKRSASPVKLVSPKRVKTEAKAQTSPSKRSLSSNDTKKQNQNEERIDYPIRGRGSKSFIATLDAVSEEEKDDDDIPATQPQAHVNHSDESEGIVDASDVDVDADAPAHFVSFVDVEAEEANSVEELSTEEIDVDLEEDDGGPMVNVRKIEDSSDDKRRALIAKAAKLIAEDPAMKTYFERMNADSEPTIVVPILKSPTAVKKATSAKSRTSAKEPGQKKLEAPFVHDDSAFDGTRNNLNAKFWPESLKKVYRALKVEDRVVVYHTRNPDAGIAPPNFQKWTSCTSIYHFLKKVIVFKENSHFVNPCRASYLDFRFIETPNSKNVLRYIARKKSQEPALFISLVEVKKCDLLEPISIPKKTAQGYYEKKQVIANLFRQELELLVAFLGGMYKSTNVTMPSWSGKDETHGLTFSTRLFDIQNRTKTRSPKKGSLWRPEASASTQTGIPVQVQGNHRVPLIDATVDGFDLSEPFSEIKSRPNMDEEAPAGSCGVIFYTISDEGSHDKIELNVQAFALLAAAPEVAWSSSSEESSQE